MRYMLLFMHGHPEGGYCSVQVRYTSAPTRRSWWLSHSEKGSSVAVSIQYCEQQLSEFGKKRRAALSVGGRAIT